MFPVASLLLPAKCRISMQQANFLCSAHMRFKRCKILLNLFVLCNYGWLYVGTVAFSPFAR